MADEQDRAEVLDEDTHDTDFPPEQLMGVDDPTRDDRVGDSVATRDRREEPEVSPADLDVEAEPPVIQPYVSEDDALFDDESELVADATIGAQDPDADSAPAAAEEAALHLEGEPDD